MIWDEDEGYDTDSPKHPRYFETHAGAADLVRKLARESAPLLPRPLVDRDAGDENDWKDAA